MASRCVLVRQHTTPHTVYAATFSPMGKELAYGGGFFYGSGFISVVGDSGEGEVVWERTNRYATFSALAFDTTARHLAASMWGSRHRYHPSVVFDREGGDDVAFDDDTADSFAYCATGVLARGPWLVVRHGASRDRPVTTHALPSRFIAGNQPRLTSSRVVAFRDVIATGVSASTWTAAEGARVESWLTLTSLHPNGKGKTHSIGAAHSGTISTITADEERGQMVTGGSDGSVAFWKLPSEAEACQPIVESVVQHHGDSVAAACYLADGSLVTADRGGHVQLWDADRPAASWSIKGGSPRALGAHPHMRRFAVGCKHGPDGGFEGLVAIVDVKV